MLDPVSDGFFSSCSPFSEEMNPTVENLEIGTLSWAEKFDLGQGDAQATTFYALTGAKFMSHVYPHVNGNLAQALSDYNSWAFAANDQVVPTDPTIRTRDVLHTIFRWVWTMRSPNSWIADDNNFSAAPPDIFSRLHDCMTPLQMHRFTTGQTSWLLDQSWETSLRERGAALTVNEYLAMRYLSPASATTIQRTEEPPTNLPTTPLPYPTIT